MLQATLDPKLVAAHVAIRVGTAAHGSTLQATLDPKLVATHGAIRVGTAAHGSTVGGQNRHPMQATLGPQLVAAHGASRVTPPIRAGREAGARLRCMAAAMIAVGKIGAK